VWGDERQIATQTVDTYISYLRGKIDETAQRALIQTVRGVGYVLR
jgi:two-component system response regulator PrrA